jgi:hypothetical protein
MPEPVPPISEESSPKTISPLDLLNKAISKVPAVKYALGIAGIAAAIAIIKTLVTDLRLALFGTILMLVLMTVLFIFAKLTSFASKEIRFPAIALLWFSLALTIATASLLFTSGFFNWPINTQNITGGNPLAAGQQPGTVPEKSTSVPELKPEQAADTSDLIVVVRDLDTKEGISGAIVEIDLLPGKSFTTRSNGDFSIDQIPAGPGANARIIVRKDGYQPRDEYVALPGPEIIYLEKSR